MQHLYQNAASMERHRANWLSAVDHVSTSQHHADRQQGPVWGYHTGADINYLIAKHFGIGGTVRFSEAEDTNVTVDLKHGGLQFNGGVSFRF